MHTRTHSHIRARVRGGEEERSQREDCSKENSLLVSTALQLLTRSVHFTRPVPLLADCCCRCCCHCCCCVLHSSRCRGFCACVWCVSLSCHFSIKADDSSDHLWHCARCERGGGGRLRGNERTLHGAPWTCNTYSQSKFTRCQSPPPPPKKVLLPRAAVGTSSILALTAPAIVVKTFSVSRIHLGSDVKILSAGCEALTVCPGGGRGEGGWRHRRVK